MGERINYVIQWSIVQEGINWISKNVNKNEDLKLLFFLGGGGLLYDNFK